MADIEDEETPPDDIEELDDEDIDDELDDVTSDARDLIDALREQSESSLRLAVRYTADEYEVLFAREDVIEQFPGPELDERVESLVMKGLGDPPQEATFFDFGALDATMRFYDNAMVAHFPYREWSGFVFTLDRTEAPLVDLVGEYLEDD